MEGRPINKADIIGTGPYKFAEWIPDRWVRIVRFPDYKPEGKADAGGGFGGAWTAYPPLSAGGQYNLTKVGATMWVLAVALEFVTESETLYVQLPAASVPVLVIDFGWMSRESQSLLWPPHGGRSKHTLSHTVLMPPAKTPKRMQTTPFVGGVSVNVKVWVLAPIGSETEDGVTVPWNDSNHAAIAEELEFVTERSTEYMQLPEVSMPMLVTDFSWMASESQAWL